MSAVTVFTLFVVVVVFFPSPIIFTALCFLKLFNHVSDIRRVEKALELNAQLLVFFLVQLYPSK